MTPIEQVAHKSRLLAKAKGDHFIIQDLSGRWWKAFSDGSGHEIDPIRFTADYSDTNNVDMPLQAKVEWVRLFASKHEDCDVTGSGQVTDGSGSGSGLSRSAWKEAFRDACKGLDGDSVYLCDKRAERVAEALGIDFAD